MYHIYKYNTVSGRLNRAISIKLKTNLKNANNSLPSLERRITKIKTKNWKECVLFTLKTDCCSIKIAHI